MPEEVGLQGRHAKVSYLVTMVAIGLTSQASQPKQGARDAASSLVARVIEMHVGPYRKVAGTLVILGLAFGLLLGFYGGAVWMTLEVAR